MTSPSFLDTFTEWLKESPWWPMIAWSVAVSTAVGLGVKKWPQIKAGVQYVDILLNLAQMLQVIRDEIKGLKHQTETIREQVQNSHPTNMRDELDDRHAEILLKLRGLEKDIGRLDDRDVQNRRDMSRLELKVDEHLEWSRSWSDKQTAADRRADDRIQDLENTIDTKEES